MPADILCPFVEVDDALCKAGNPSRPCHELGQTFWSLNVQENIHTDTRTLPGLQWTFSACPVSVSTSHAHDAVTSLVVSDGSSLVWPLQGGWSQDANVPHAILQRIPLWADRPVSLMEGCHSEAKVFSSRYKTELCRPFEESGTCKYGSKCQFAHGAGELRGLSRHPKYKTEPCRTFHSSGICPYGARCHFIHNAEECCPLPWSRKPLRYSVSSGEPLPPPLPPSPPPSTSCACRLPDGAAAFPCNALGHSLYKSQLGPPGPLPFPGLLLLQKSLSTDSLSDPEDSGSSRASSGSASPGRVTLGRRLPIFHHLSISDD